MSASLISIEPQNLAGQAAADAQYYRRVLHELIDIGADLARKLHQQVQAQAEPVADVTVPFDRIARIIRRTISLARKLSDPIPARAIAHSAQHRAAARQRIIRDVEDAIQRTACDHEAETLHAEFLDRLDGPDLDDAIADRPVADIIVDICRDLGIAAPGAHAWKRRTPEDVTTLCRRAAGRSAMPHAAPSVLPKSASRDQTGSDPPSP